MSKTEKPKYQVVSSVGDIEIRQYMPMLIAEVNVKGSQQQASSQGFRLLADFIFGNNTVQQDIAMTAPVQQQASAKIAMTAPVQQQASGDVWKISFVMPSQYTQDTLPQPNNKKIAIREVAPQQFIVIRFAGTNSRKNIDKHEQQLRDYIVENQIEVIGSPKYAFYNSPWTPPFLRRNEVMFEMR